jgi:hypothetical protein
MGAPDYTYSAVLIPRGTPGTLDLLVDLVLEYMYVEDDPNPRKVREG